MIVHKKYRTTLLLAPFVLFSVYVLLSEKKPVESSKGWLHLASNISNTSIFQKRNLNRNEDLCILRESIRNKRQYVDFRVIIITYNRAYPLWRLLQSIDVAFYGKDRVVIDIWLDRSKSQLVHYETLHSALKFRFSKGRCNVFVHPEHVGIAGQWLSTWSPPSNPSEISVILEDDITVSPHFYRYLKLVQKKYGQRRDISGFSLQGSSIRHSDGKCCLNVPLENKVFLYPTLGTSGFSPNRRNWFQFQAWFKKIIHQKIDVTPFIKNHIALKWYQQFKREGTEDSMWEMEYLYYTQNKKEFTLYPNFPGNKGFAFNWFEDGLHSTGISVRSKDVERKKMVLDWTLDFDQLPDIPIYIDNSGTFYDRV